jgi:DNA-binding transcriptional MerR regulator
MSDLFIFRGIDFELGYTDYLESEESKRLSEVLNAKRHKPQQGAFSYRIINHWESNNLLSNKRSGGKGWRRYSIMDLVWLYIIAEMRKFGISLDLIKKVKDTLLEQNDSEASKFPYLEYYSSLCLINIPVFLLIFSSGQAHPVTEEEYISNREFSSKRNHMQINLNSLLQKILPDIHLKVNDKSGIEYNLEEKKAIQLMRLGEYENAEIILQNGNKQRLTKKDKDKLEDLISFITKKRYLKVNVRLKGDYSFDVVCESDE